MVEDNSLTGAEAGAWFDFIISRAATDAALAIRLSDLLNAAGFATLIEDEGFGHDGLMGVMPEALTRGARVIALISESFLADDRCVDQALGALAGDPGNKSARLILFKISQCAPRGLIGRQRIVDLSALLGDDARLAEVLLAVVGHEYANASPATLAGLETEPRQLAHGRIAAVRGFVGRAAEMQTIDRALLGAGSLDRARIVLLQGRGGVGVSTLARQYAHERRDRFAGVWWLDAQTPSSLGCGLRMLAVELLPGAQVGEEPGATTRAMLERLGGALGDAASPWLLVCDGPAAASLMADWRLGPGIVVLATGGPGEIVPGAMALEIAPLPVTDASVLLKNHLAGRTLGAGEAQSIAAALGGHPLSLKLAAASLAGDKPESAESYLASLARHQEDVPAGANYDRRFRACLWQSLETAEAEAEEAGAVLALASLLAAHDIPLALFELSSDRYPDELQPIAQDTALRERVLGILDRLALIERDPTGRTFSVHPLVQQALRDALGGESIDERWVACAATVLDEVFPDPSPENSPVCDQLVAHVLAISERAGKSGVPSLGRLLNVCGLHLSAEGEAIAPERLYRHALEVVESSRGPIHPDLAATLINLGAHLTLAGRLGEAAPMLERALAIARSAFGADHPDTLQIRETLARLRAVPLPSVAVAAPVPPPARDVLAEAQVEIVASAARAGRPVEPATLPVARRPADSVEPLRAVPPLVLRSGPSPMATAQPASDPEPEPQRRRGLLDRLLRRDRE